MSILTLHQVDEDHRKATRSIRVFHVVNGEHYAGAERVQDLLAGYLPRFNVEPSFICVKPDRFADRRMFQDVELTSMPVRHPWPRSTAAKLAARIDDQRIDLVHAHTPRSLWLASLAAKLSARPLVYTMHDVSLGEPASAVRALVRARTISMLKQTDTVLCVSQAALELAESFALGRQRILIPNGVPTRPKLVRPELRTPPTIGTVALMRPRKGIETLIDAAGLLQARGIDLRLKLVGPFETVEYERVIRRQIERRRLTEITDLPGFTSDVDGALGQFDLFAMPSVLPEGLPMVVLEAMAAGLPVVGSNVAGVRDVIRSGVDGYLVAPGDPNKLAQAIQNAVASQEQWQRMSDQARRRQRALFSAEKMAERTARCYDDILSTRRY